MSSETEELMLLERVFLRLGSAETDEQLQTVLAKFLSPVLLKLSSSSEVVRQKVMELLSHVNKRVKSRPQIQLPVDSLLVQYQDSSVNPFVTNFTVIYLKLGFPRLNTEKQMELLPEVLSALENKPQAHLDSLLLIIIPLMGKIKVPTDPAKVPGLFGLDKKPQISKHLLGLMLDILLVPYSSVTQSEINEPPAGMSEFSFKRVINNYQALKPDELEEIKLGIVRFLATGVCSNEDVLLSLVVAAADTRFSVANLADMELKKVVGSIDWKSAAVSNPFFLLFLGSQTKNLKPDLKKYPACTRIRLKLLNYMCRFQNDALIFPASIQIVFDSLYGTNTNTKLKTLALNFTTNLIRYANPEQLSKVAPVLLSGMQKLINEADDSQHCGQAHIISGMLAEKFPKIVYHNVALLELFFKNLEKATNNELKLQIREGLLNLILAYKFDIFPEQADKDGRLNILFALIKIEMVSDEDMVRFVGVRTLATIFPASHVPAKFLMLIATGDSKDEVSNEALKALYGTSRKSDVEFTQNKCLPEFSDIIQFVYSQSESVLQDKTKRYTIGVHTLPFNIKQFMEIVVYLRICLLQHLENVPLQRQFLNHPCEYSPKIRQHLQDIYRNDHNQLIQYFKLNRQILLANPSVETFSSMVELIGCVPDLIQLLQSDQQWIRDQLSSTKEEIRELAAKLYALTVNTLNSDQFNDAILELISSVDHKTIEVQHGAIIAIGDCLCLRQATVDLHKNSVLTLYNLLKQQPNQVLIGGICYTLGELGRKSGLPLDDGVVDEKNGSPDAKKPATVTKCAVIGQLIDCMNNTKLSAKVRERAIKALGLVCVGERFPHSKTVLKALLRTAKEIKDVDLHFTISECLVMCCKSVCAPEKRDYWLVTVEEWQLKCGNDDENVDLKWVLDELLVMAKSTHPNTKQASCIWLLAILKGFGQREIIKNRLKDLQNTFMDLLCENNEFVQDAASKGLCVIYDTYKSEELLNALVKQLTSGTKQKPQVTDDTKLFEEGQLGKTPTGGNLTTYKELCSLASDLNKPDLIYQFMHLANHNAVWNSKKGAAFGFQSIAEKCGADLKPQLYLIVPKLYRYQFDPTPSIQASMHNIWRVLVSEPQKTLDEFYYDILRDLLENLNSSQYRVRQSCCLALQDFLKGSGNRSIHDCVDYMDELWMKLFRVMDDHHEATRITATKTTRVLSKLCIKGCDQSQGKAGIKMVENILPPLLNNGITNPVSEVRLISLQTISELVGSAGKQLKPFLPKLIPALLQATGELESAQLSYLSVRHGAQSQVQEVIDSARATFAKSHFTTETVAKSLQYADSSILGELVPKIVDLLKSVGLGTKIACAHFIVLLMAHMGKEEIQPYTGKFLAVLVNGLTDRNAAIRKHFASAIGHLVVAAKDSSLEKLFAKLELWYFEREDDTIRSACAHTIQSIGIHNQEILKQYSNTILPLVFFAMHSEKTPETENTLKVWTEIWSEHSPGTETGIRQNLDRICVILGNGLESPSWTMKAQAANAVATVATKLGSTMDTKHRNTMINILLSGLAGRTWNGKDKLLKALASICTNCKEAIKEDDQINTTVIIDTVLKECKKTEITYKISALECLGEILSSLEIDKFDQVYGIIQEILIDESKSDNDDLTGEEIVRNRENLIKLKEISYETLGKTWPKNSEKTQEKYRQLFVEHCANYLPKLSRSVQVSVMAALYNYVDKLILFNHFNETNEEILARIIDHILAAVKYALGISKHTRLRKEGLNVIFCLAKKLEQDKNGNEFKKLRLMFNESLPEISGDNQPEIKSRLTDIKNIL